jgi:mannose-6-phosphate isomerase-like protein (cupin superfamily)
MVKDGSVVDPRAFCGTVRLGGRPVDDVLDPRKAAECLQRGATLVVQSLQRTHPPLADFADRVTAESGHRTQINSYLSPPGSSGLVEHADDHHVFVVQVDGTKHWVVDGEHLVLAPGDCLYVPAGVRHAAQTRTTHSLHLTIGVLATTYRHVVERMLAEVPALDDPLPLCVWDDDIGVDTRVTGGLRERVELASSALDAADLSAVVAREASREFIAAGNVGRIAAAVTGGGVSLDDVVVWADVRPYVQPVDGPDVEPDASEQPMPRPRLRVLLADRVLRVPSAVAPAISALSRSRDGLRVGSLPGLDDAGRLALARRLLAEGACVVR